MPQKLRVACLHGYGTNAKFLERQMRSFRKTFDQQIEFVFLDAPFEAPHAFILDEKVLALIEGQTKGWNPLTSVKYNQTRYVNQVLQALQKYFDNQQYDGIIGFSQGAVMVHLIIKLIQEGKINWKGLQNIKFCILASGNYWAWDELEVNNRKQLSTPSIHLISQTDFLYRKSIFVTAQYKSPLVIHHEFGHSFPRLGREAYNIIRKYIRDSTTKTHSNLPVTKL